MGTSKPFLFASENRRSVQGGSEKQAEYIPEHDPKRLLGQ